LLPTAPSENRPAWVDAPAGVHDGVYLTKIIVGPETTREACDQQVPTAVRTAVDDYSWRLNQLRGDGSTKPNVEPPTDEELRRRVIGEQWEERVKIDGADRIFLHVQLKFDASLQRQWRDAAQASLKHERLWKLTGLFLAAIWGLFVMNVALRVDARLSGRPARIALWVAAGVLGAIPLAMIS
jgi:hypothetical protein